MISISLSTFAPIMLGLAASCFVIPIYFKMNNNDLRGGLRLSSLVGGAVLFSSMVIWKAAEHRIEENRVAAAEVEVREEVREEKQERLFRVTRERQDKERAEVEVARTALIESLSPEWERLRLLPTQYRNGNDFPRDSFQYEERILLIGVFLEQHGDSLPKLTLEQYGLFRADIRKVIMSYIDFKGEL